MKRIVTSLFFLMGVLFSVSSQIGEFETAMDIGDPKIKGSSSYDPESQVYTLKGGGSNIWFDHDEFHFLFKKLKGDFVLTANFKLVGNEDGNGHRKTGWMIRNSTEHDAVSANSCVHGDGLVVLQWRVMRGAHMRDPADEIFFPKQYFGETIVQLQKVGKTVTMRIAHPGLPLEEMGSVDMPELNDEVLVGPYALAHDPEDIQEVQVWNVQVSKYVAPDWHPNPLVETTSQDAVKLASCLEQIEIGSRKRKVLFESENTLSAPYFGPRGEFIYVKQGDKTMQWSSVELKQAENSSPGPSGPARGKYEYYASNSTFTNQLYRKGNSGNSDSLQLTFDRDHVWFPQISPDGKWVAYLSLPHYSNPRELSAYERVSLKLWPTDGGSSRTIAHFYGGKGSFESYAWSNDGSSLLFISRK